MKGTDHFKEVIKNHLDNRASTDPLFAESYAKPNKNLDACITYILNEVKKSGRQGFADDEIYSMAIHYYDEDNIQVGKPVQTQVVVNKTIAAPASKEAKPTKAAPTKAAPATPEPTPEPAPAPVKKTVKRPIVPDNQTSLF